MMPRSIPKWIVGAVSLVILFIVGWNLSQLYQAAEQRQADYAYQPSKASGFRIDAKTNEPTPPYRPSCNNPADREDAELCAQWAAVEQVAETNRLTSVNLRLAIISMLATFIATGFLVWTFYETRKTSRQELRAYVFPGIFKIEKIGGSDWRTYVLLINGGNTPAKNVRTTFAAKIVPFPLKSDDIPKPDLGGVLYSALGPKAERQVNAHLSISANNEAQILASKRCVIAQLVVGYTTYSGQAVTEPPITTVVTGSDLKDGRMRVLTPRALQRMNEGESSESPQQKAALWHSLLGLLKPN